MLSEFDWEFSACRYIARTCALSLRCLAVVRCSLFVVRCSLFVVRWCVHVRLHFGASIWPVRISRLF
jgi:hypothetical protein